MRHLWFCLAMLGLLCLGPVTTWADDASASTPAPPSTSAPLNQTSAFDRAYAESFYQFDACGDGIAGRIYRNALSQRVAQCPFSADAKARFQQSAGLQRRQSARMMAKLIEDNGGLPMRLEGMTRTCREQIDSPEYRLIRGHLDDYAAGKTGPDAVVAAPCDSTEITP